MALTNLTSCEPIWCNFYKDTYVNLVEKIELVKYNNDNYEMVNPTNVALRFDFSKVEKLEVLEEEKICEFLTDFEQIDFIVENVSVNEPTGYCLLWYLINGNFIVFSCTIVEGDRAYDMVAEFSEECEFLRHYAYFGAAPHFDLVLGKFFESYIL